MAPKGNKNAVGNKGGGRPTLYEPRFADMAEEIAYLGATDADLARIFDVCETTINAWKNEHIEFSAALKNGKEFADAKVAKSLFQRATGYQHEAVKIAADAKTGAEHIVQYIEHYAPDTTACIFWLKNRQPKHWRDKVDLSAELTGKDGAPLIDLPTAVVDLAQAYAKALKGT